jgi:hypothetical protein
MPTTETHHKIFGIIGIILAFLGLLSVLVGPAICDAIIPPPPPHQQLAETVASLKEHLVARLKKLPPPPQAPRARFSPRELPFTLSLIFAATAIMAGSVSFLRREDYRFAGVACGVATLTLAWYALLLALAAAVLCVILYCVLTTTLT